jgi:hypothetical protein
MGMGLGVLLLGWRAFLHYGPGPSMYQFHAKALIRSRLAFPRPAPPVFLPEPEGMSSADVQLRLMKWWDGKHWLPEALAHGEQVKGGLQVHAGELALVDVTSVTASLAKVGVTGCAVHAKVRWDFPADLQELLRVKEIIALRFGKGLTPGQAGEMTCVFTQQGWRWELVSAEAPGGGRLSVSRQSPGFLDWVF